MNSVAETAAMDGNKAGIRGGITVSWCAGGCFFCNSVKVASQKGATLSSEEAILTAPLKSPSSHF